ncbi:unnamed protein product [Absidia cylindrospora]
MRLRVRHPQGVLTVEDLTPEQFVESLCKVVENLIGLSSEKWVQVSGGFPPKPITDRNISLQTAGIKNGDALNVTLVDPHHSIAVREGFLVQRVMDDDNSCLFRSIGYVLERDSSTMVHALRQVVAQAIQDDPETYLDVLLGQPRSKYIEWIKKDTSWGGAIELSIFSKHYSVEIVSVDVQTGRMDRFGEGAFKERVFILYSGIHYDALALSPMENCSTEFDETRFPVSNDDSLLVAAQELASVLRRDHKYTDVANFSLKCENCQTGLVGEKDAQAHAMSTGHTNFVEYT